MTVPAPPHPFPDPEEFIWDAGRAIMRVHGHHMGSTEFNPTDVSLRFRPIVAADGTVIATIYGSDAEAGAICETVFHDIVWSDPAPSVPRAELLVQVLSPIAPARDLCLAGLVDPHIKKLKVTHGELIETDADEYAATVPWAQIIHDQFPQFDGMIWHSKQHHGTLSLTLWADRVDRFNDLVASTAQPPLPLHHGPGFDQVSQVATAMGVTISL